MCAFQTVMQHTRILFHFLAMCAGEGAADLSMQIPDSDNENGFGDVYL